MPAGDLAYAARELRKAPVFAMAAVAAICLGIGASTAIFSVTNAVLLRRLPYKDPDRLVSAWIDLKKANVRDVPFSNGDLFDLRAGTETVFEDIGGVFTFRVIVPGEDGRPERIHKAQVTPNFFRMTGAGIAFGRDFTSSDARPQPARPAPGLPQGSVAILSYEYWQRRYGGNTAVIGREMTGSGERGPRIVGVLAPGFELLFPAGANLEPRPDVWIANDLGYDRKVAALRVIGRLRRGVTLEHAQQRVDSVAFELRKSFPEKHTSGLHIRLEPMRRHLVAAFRPTILALMSAAIILLLIACANVANLVLVRASLRERELAVRSALGASGWRIMRQVLTGALLLSGLGTLLGVGLAWLGIHGLLAIAPTNVPRLDTVAIAWREFGFAALAGLAAAIVFGGVPGMRAGRRDPMQALRGGARAAGLAAARSLRNGVVVAEVALSFVLLFASSLLFRSFLSMQRIDPGYDPHGILTFLLVRDWTWSEQRGRAAFLREIQERLRALPGVEDAAASVRLPLAGGFFTMEWGRPVLARAAEFQPADCQSVLPGYFETLRTRLVEGRTFTEHDNAAGRNVLVIDKSLAAKAFPNESAIGKRILVRTPKATWVEVIGVVAHQRLTSLAEPGREQIYLPDGFMGIGVSRYWEIRTAGDPAKLAAAVRAELARFDRQLLISEMQPMDAVVDRARAGTRFALLLIGAFAVVAALLAGVGLYGVLSAAVQQRTAEIGVRMALGATPSGIFRLVVGHGLRLSAAGIAIGLAAALILTRSMTAMLVGIKPIDPPTFAAMAALFLVIAGISSWLPARRAAGLAPVAALRKE